MEEKKYTAEQLQEAETFLQILRSIRSAAGAPMTERRLLSEKEAGAYTGLGRGTVRKWAQKIGAIRRFGTRVLYDRVAMDEALDRMGGKMPQAAEEAPESAAEGKAGELYDEQGDIADAIMQGLKEMQ